MAKGLKVPRVTSVVLVFHEHPSKNVNEVFDPDTRASVCLDLGARQVTALEVDLGAPFDVGGDQPDPSAALHRLEGMPQQRAQLRRSDTCSIMLSAYTWLTDWGGNGH